MLLPVTETEVASVYFRVWLAIVIVAFVPASVAERIVPGEVQLVEIESSRLTVLAVELAVFAVDWAAAASAAAETAAARAA